MGRGAAGGSHDLILSGDPPVKTKANMLQANASSNTSPAGFSL